MSSVSIAFLDEYKYSSLPEVSVNKWNGMFVAPNEWNPTDEHVILGIDLSLVI